MFRLFNLTLILLIMFIAMIFAARVTGSTQPSPLTALFTNPDGTRCERPCLFGIRPGQMTIDEAIALVKAHWFLSDVRAIQTDRYVFPLAGIGKDTFAGKQFLIRLAPGPGDQKPLLVTGVSLELTEPGQDLSSYSQLPVATLGTLIAFAGDPETYSQTSYDGSHTFFFPGQHIRAKVEPKLRTSAFLRQETYLPRPDDVVTSFQIDEPLQGGMSGEKWCGFTAWHC